MTIQQQEEKKEGTNNMKIELFGYVLVSKLDIERQITDIRMQEETRFLQRERDMQLRHESFLATLERVTASHHDTLKKMLNYMMTSLGGDSYRDPEQSIDDFNDGYEHGRRDTVNATSGVDTEPKIVRTTPQVPTTASEAAFERQASKLAREVEKRLEQIKADMVNDNPIGKASDATKQLSDDEELHSVLGIWGDLRTYPIQYTSEFDTQ